MIYKRSKKIGLPPGTILFTGEDSSLDVQLEQTTYNEAIYEISKLDRAVLSGLKQDVDKTIWLNIDGIHDAKLLHQIGNEFGLLSLTLEDLATSSHRPKYEELEEYCFIVIPMLTVDEQTGLVEREQISILWSDKWVLSFQQRPGDVFDALRKRLYKGKGRIRSSGAPYLAYALMDLVVDHYFLIAERALEVVSDVEQSMLKSETHDPRHDLVQVRKDILELSTVSVPLREAIRLIRKSESLFVPSFLTPYLSDLDDHIEEILDVVEVARVRATGSMEQYQVNVANQLNAVMKLLTIVSTVFIPLTFIAGIYGMNFAHIPELNYRWGYPVAIGSMFLIAIAMLAGFRWRKWI